MKQNRNDKCQCGSGKKYKHCCLLEERERDAGARERWKEKFKAALEERAKTVQEQSTNVATPARQRRVSAATAVAVAAMMGMSGGRRGI